jgi:hypothetical protein
MRSKCFANENGYCAILNDTFFKRPCPFFKTHEEYEAGLKPRKTIRDKYEELGI